MGKILVEYCPDGLSNIAQMLIRSTITPSMKSNDGTTSQYDTEPIVDLLKENIKMLRSDLIIINNLREQGISFIEI